MSLLAGDGLNFNMRFSSFLCDHGSCAYLARKFSNSNTENILASRCVCLCDDDNDIEMALACLHAYVPSITSESMKQVMTQHSDKFTLTARDEELGDLTLATEKALMLILDRIHGEYSHL
jgi:hypothetical protein